MSDKLVNFPAVLGNQQVLIETNVLKNEIPLLLSRSSLKKAQNDNEL